jgi:RimJ/RimL family protein N-acetyltransferase
MFIVTERLFLRPVWQEDGEAIQLLLNDWDVASRLARVPWPYTRADADDFTRYAERADENGTERVLAISLRPAARLIGLIGCHHLESGEDEIGYWLGKSYWGHGFASEASKAFINGLFQSLRMTVITAGYHVGNQQSAKVLAKQGFTPTHVEQQHCRAQNADVPVQKVRLLRDAWLCSEPIATSVAA